MEMSGKCRGLSLGLREKQITLQKQINQPTNMRKSLFTALLALVALAGQAKKDVVWEKPSAFMGVYNSEFEITKVELKPHYCQLQAWQLDPLRQGVVSTDARRQEVCLYGWRQNQ